MPEITLHYWLPNGVGISVKSEADSFDDLLSISGRYLGMGLLIAPPANEGIERELIVTVMRREKSDGTPILDFYPAWGAGTDVPYGTYKFVHKYLNNDGDVDQFLSASGFRSLQDIPLYDGQAPLKRNVGKAHPKETRVPTPFYALRKEGKEKIDTDGKPYRPWELVGYELAPQSAQQNAPESRQNAPNPSAPPQSAPNTPLDTEWTHNAQSVVKFLGWAQNQYGLSHGQVIEALAYFSWNPLTGVDQYEGTKEQAMAACIAFACKYDPASVAALDIAPGMKQLTIEMIELHNVPF